HVDKIFGEPVPLEHTLESGVTHEDRIVAELLQPLRDADAVERGAERGFGIENDGLAGPELAHRRRSRHRFRLRRDLLRRGLLRRGLLRRRFLPAGRSGWRRLLVRRRGGLGLRLFVFGRFGGWFRGLFGLSGNRRLRCLRSGLLRARLGGWFRGRFGGGLPGGLRFWGLAAGPFPGGGLTG